MQKKMKRQPNSRHCMEYIDQWKRLRDLIGSLVFTYTLWLRPFIEMKTKKMWNNF